MPVLHDAEIEMPPSSGASFWAGSLVAVAAWTLVAAVLLQR
jgi:hypothetical protein